MSRTRAALAFSLVALAFFGLGLLAAGRLGAPERSGPPDSAPPGPPDATVLSPSPPLFPPADAGPAEPRIALDPSSVELLPDASLRLTLPPGFGGGGGGVVVVDDGSPDGAAPR